MSVEQDLKWDKVITSKQSGLNLHLKRVWDYRDLIGLLVRRDFVTYYKQTILGPIWYLFQPICSTLMYMLVFGSLAEIGTDSIPQPLFYFSGTMLWTYFSGNLLEVSNVFFKNKGLFNKIFFPRLVVPISTTISLLIKLGIQFVLFIVIYISYFCHGADLAVSPKIMLFPLVVLWIGFLSCGIGMVVSSITTKYRDIALVLEFLITLWVYATPVAYPLSEVPGKLKILLYLNPVSAPIEFFRYCFFGVSSISTGAVMLSIGMTVVFLVLGLRMFSKNERTFVDVI